MEIRMEIPTGSRLATQMLMVIAMVIHSVTLMGFRLETQREILMVTGLDFRMER